MVNAAEISEIEKLKKENLELKEELETRKLIERAKGVLMEKSGISEGGAYRHIQKTSMDKRVSMSEVSELIIAALGAEKK